MYRNSIVLSLNRFYRFVVLILRPVSNIVKFLHKFPDLTNLLTFQNVKYVKLTVKRDAEM